MEKIELIVKDKMDIALLLTGINWVRKSNLVSAKNYLDLPKQFSKDKILEELVDDYDRLNSMAVQLCKLIEDNKWNAGLQELRVKEVRDVIDKRIRKLQEIKENTAVKDAIKEFKKKGWNEALQEAINELLKNGEVTATKVVKELIKE